MELHDSSPNLIRFGVFEVDFVAAELRKRGRHVKLEAQPYHLLCTLVRRPGELVSREELQKELWSDDTFVEFDHSLNTAVKKIRQALDDSPRSPRFIETVPRQGYRFIGAVDVVGERLSKKWGAPGRRRLSATSALLIALVLAVTIVTSTWALWHYYRVRWVYNEAIPEMARLVEQQDYFAAFQLGRRVEPIVRDAPQFLALRDKYSVPMTVNTTPENAVVFFKPYLEPDAEWILLGRSPLKNIPMPVGNFRWKIEKEGFETVEGAESSYPSNAATFILDEAGTRPPGMVRVLWPEEDDFWIDRYEVTNGQFKKFVDTGGYQRSEFWKHEFIRDGRRLSLQEALGLFRDKTGRPGPATWELGTFPDGQENYPVAGVSWYEATAYAEFVGKSLPTRGHWSRAAAAVTPYPDIVQLSNYGDRGSTAVGVSQGLGRYGTYDMAGNLREWCWNTAEDLRIVSGGAWNNVTRLFNFQDVLPPFDRSATNGFRCVRYISPPSEKLTAAVSRASRGRDYSRETPVSDQVFESIKKLYAYDRTALKPEVDSVDDTSPYWRREQVSFEAAYGGERVTAWLFLPKNVAQPYQTVIYNPPAMAYDTDTLQEVELRRFDFVVRGGGRALFHPIYKGTYGRRISSYWELGPNAWRDIDVQQFKDFARSLDYLETRNDIDMDKLAYFGSSFGACAGPIFCALDTRPKVMVLLGGGFAGGRVLPEVDQFHFAHRSKQPALMINGKYDFLYPLDSSQRPMFRLLGAPEEHKRHAIFEAGHFPDRTEVARETLTWLDRYLGEVKVKESER